MVLESSGWANKKSIGIPIIYLYSSLRVATGAKFDQSSRVAIIKKPTAAKPFKILAGNKTVIEPPAKTPIALANNKATTEPKNTALGCGELPPMAIAANWLLSPISAKKTVAKVTPISCQFISKTTLPPSQSLKIKFNI